MNTIKQFFISNSFYLLILLFFLASYSSYSQAIITAKPDTVYKAIYFHRTTDSTQITLTDYSQITIPNSIVKSISECEAVFFLKDSGNIRGSIKLINKDDITIDSYRYIHTYKKSDIVKIDVLDEEKPCGVSTLGLALSRTAFAAVFYRNTSPKNPGFLIYGGVVPGRSTGLIAGGLGADMIIDFTRNNYADFGVYLGAGITNYAYTTNLFFNTGITLRVSFIHLKFGYVFEDKPTTDWNDSEYYDIFIGFGFRI